MTPKIPQLLQNIVLSKIMNFQPKHIFKIVILVSVVVLCHNLLASQGVPNVCSDIVGDL